MKKYVIVFLSVSNVITLGLVWYYAHNLESLYSLMEFKEQLHQEFLMTTPLPLSGGFVAHVATPTIFRSLEQCVKTANEWNVAPSFPGNLWSCEKYK